MRWVAAQPGPSWSVHDVHVGWVEALRGLGEHVVEYNLQDRLALYANALLDVTDDLGGERPPGEGLRKLRRALTDDQAMELAVNGLASTLWKVRPDVLFVTSGFFVPHELLDHARRAYGTRVIVLHTEEPYEVERELALAEHADLNMLNDPLHLERFEQIAPSVYSPHCYRPTVHHPGRGWPELECDLGFCGTGFGSRRWFFETMHEVGGLEGLDVLLAGNWQGVSEDSPLRPLLGAGDPAKCLDNPQTAELYRSARMGINLYRRESDDGNEAHGWAMGPREVEMAACGLWFARDPRPEGDELFPFLPTFGGPEEAAAVIQWAHRHPEQREAAAVAARAAIQDRTFSASATKLLRLFDRQPVTTS